MVRNPENLCSPDKIFNAYNFSDSDCDSPNDIGKSPKSSVRPSQSGYSGKTKHIPQSITGAATGLDKPSYKHSKQSSPSRSRVEVRVI